MLIIPEKQNRLLVPFAAYLKEAMGIQPKVKQWENAKQLPLYLRELYEFYQTKFLNSEALLILVKNGAQQATPATVAKHFIKLREKWAHDLILVNEALSSIQRKRMVEQKIPFIIPGNQMYLPMIGLDFREHFKKIHTPREILSPSTQALILHAIYHEKKEAYTTKDFVQLFNYSTMTVTRAFDELHKVGLGEHSVSGKERRLHFPEKKQYLWERALPFLKSPVKKRLHIMHFKPKGPHSLSGLSALAEYTQLAEPENRVLAIYHFFQKKNLSQNNIEVIDRSESGSTEIEYWSYAPELLAQNGLVDRLSLYLSLEDEQDARTEMAKEELLRGMQW